METNQQERYDASRTAALIEKNAELYERSPQFKFMVDNTVWLHSEDQHESMRIIGGDLIKGKY